MDELSRPFDTSSGKSVSAQTKGRVAKVLHEAIQAGIMGPERHLLGLLDTDGIGETIHALKSAFPGNFTHLFAAKSNTMLDVLKIVRTHGMGCEVASPAEFEQALRAGFEPTQISFDEPAKTEATLQKVIGLGVGLHIDNFLELDRVKEIAGVVEPSGPIGFRINPQRGGGSIASTSTATPTSKFGVGLKDAGNRERLVAEYRDIPWLNRLHVHVGAQGCSFELMAQSIRDVVDLANEINDASGSQKVTAIDVGGGLPVNFEGDEISPTFSEYADILRAAAPQLFTGEFDVFTEFGRAVLAKSGLLVTRVEYVKQTGGKNIAITHAGAQIAARTVFAPNDWGLRFSVYDASGNPKSNDHLSYDLAGPCCFSGDLIARDIMLPEIEPGDIVVAHDTGAYYFTIPYFFNSLPMPAIFGFEDKPDKTDFTEFRAEQTVDQVLAMIG